MNTLCNNLYVNKACAAEPVSHLNLNNDFHCDFCAGEEVYTLLYRRGQSQILFVFLFVLSRARRPQVPGPDVGFADTRRRCRGCPHAKAACKAINSQIRSVMETMARTADFHRNAQGNCNSQQQCLTAINGSHESACTIHYYRAHCSVLGSSVTCRVN